MFDGVADLDQVGTLAGLDDAQAELVAAEVAQARLLAHWADLHGCPECDGGAELRALVPGGERGKVYGGDGCPPVLEFCVAEPAALLGVSPASLVNRLADVQDLRFRHPRLWRRVLAGQVRMFRAQEVVRRTRHLGRDAAWWVDEQVADAVTGTGWTRFQAILEAAVIAADPATAEARRKAAEEDQHVTLGRSDQHGLRTLVARLRGHHAAYLEAMITEVAHKLAALGDPAPVGQRRATALALLANPLVLLRVLAAYDAAVAAGRITPRPAAPEPPADRDEDVPTADDPANDLPDDVPADEPGEGPDAGEMAEIAPDELDPALPVRVPNPVLAPCADLAAVLGWLAGLRWERLLPQVVFYVHADRQSLADGAGVARWEEHGPLTVPQLAEFFGSDTALVRTRPVLDLADVAPQDGYQGTARMREAVRQVAPGDVFPYAGSTGRRLDHDHPIPYLPLDEGGPPGQTHLGNQAPLGRFHHRLKTHGAWRLAQPEVGVYLWRSPHGHYFQTDSRGTHRLTPQAGQVYWDATAADQTRPADGTGPADPAPT